MDTRTRSPRIPPEGFPFSDRGYTAEPGDAQRLVTAAMTKREPGALAPVPDTPPLVEAPSAPPPSIVRKLHAATRSMPAFAATGYNKKTRAFYASDSDVYAAVAPVLQELGIWLSTSVDPDSVRYERVAVDMADSVNSKKDRKDEDEDEPASLVSSCIVRLTFADVDSGETWVVTWPALSTKNESTSIQGAITTALRHALSKQFLRPLDATTPPDPHANKNPPGRGAGDAYQQIWALVKELKLPTDRIGDLVSRASGGRVTDGQIKALTEPERVKAVELLEKSKVLGLTK